jgi:hypothetical protein
VALMVHRACLLAIAAWRETGSSPPPARSPRIPPTPPPAGVRTRLLPGALPPGALRFISLRGS